MVPIKTDISYLEDGNYYFLLTLNIEMLSMHMLTSGLGGGNGSGTEHMLCKKKKDLNFRL